MWNASSDGFSFVISFASRSGPGLRGNPGFIASWRPIHQNRTAVKVIRLAVQNLPGSRESLRGHARVPQGAIWGAPSLGLAAP